MKNFVTSVISFEEKNVGGKILKKTPSQNFNKWMNIIYQQYKSVIRRKF